MAQDDFFSREEALGGLPARRAHTLLYLIESKIAHWVARSRRAMDVFLTEEAAEDRDLAFLEAFAQEKAPPLQPTVQHLEQYAPHWQHWVPGTPQLRAALAHVMAEKYQLLRGAVPGIIAALHLDEADTQRAYEKLYNLQLETIYTRRVNPIQWLRWGSSNLTRWMELLPPFWIVFALTLTETMGAGMLAIPIALAGVGPWVGLVILIVLGLLNVLTIAYTAEAVARNGIIRYGSAFIGRVIQDYMGKWGMSILLIGLFFNCFFALFAYYMGFAITLADATPVRAEFWVAGLALLGLFYISRESLNTTVASALVVGVINILLLVVISALAFTHFDPANLTSMTAASTSGGGWNPLAVGLIFGVVISSYFGHLSVSNCAQVVLKRDASGRALIQGSMAAMVVVMVIYCIWIIVIYGALSPGVLLGETSTVLVPLAAEVGPLVQFFGAVFVILAMGMASIHHTLGLSNLIHEQIPAVQHPIVKLPKRRGRLLLHRRRRGADAPRLALTYLGLEGVHPRLRLDVQIAGHTQYVEFEVDGRWTLSQLEETHPEFKAIRDNLSLEVVEAERGAIRLHVITTMGMSYEGDWDTLGLRMADVLALPQAEQRLVNWMIRQGEVSLEQAATQFDWDQATTNDMFQSLTDLGFVQVRHVDGQTLYRTHIVKRGSRLSNSVWVALGGDAEPAHPLAPEVPHPFVARLGKRGRFLLGVTPMLLIFLFTEVVLLTGSVSFSESLSFVGVLVVSLLGGIFPVFMFVSGRKKGRHLRGGVWRFFSHPVFLVGIYALSLSSVFLHGLVIWQNPWQRISATIVGVLLVIASVVLVRQGAFKPRYLLELREEVGPKNHAVYNVNGAGELVIAEVRLSYPSGEKRDQAASGDIPDFGALQAASFSLMPDDQIREIKVWAHHVTDGQDSQSLPALLEVVCGETVDEVDLALSGGQAMISLTTDDKIQCKIVFLE